MPALVKSSVGSPWGTSELLRTRRCPLLSKKRRKVSRMSLPLQNLPMVGLSVKSASMVVGVPTRNYRRVGARDQLEDVGDANPNDGSRRIYDRAGGTPPG